MGKQLPGGPRVSQRAAVSQQKAKIPKTSPVKNNINLKIMKKNLKSF